MCTKLNERALIKAEIKLLNFIAGTTFRSDIPSFRIIKTNHKILTRKQLKQATKRIIRAYLEQT